MKIEQWQIERVKPYDKNPRRNDKAVEAVAKSISEFGFRQPIVVDAGGVIVVGHTRYKAAMRLGLKTVPVALEKGRIDALKAQEILSVLENYVAERSNT